MEVLRTFVLLEAIALPNRRSLYRTGDRFTERAIALQDGRSLYRTGDRFTERAIALQDGRSRRAPLQGSTNKAITKNKVDFERNK
jgi:hypothetical protein